MGKTTLCQFFHTRSRVKPTITSLAVGKFARTTLCMRWVQDVLFGVVISKSAFRRHSRSADFAMLAKSGKHHGHLRMHETSDPDAVVATALRLFVHDLKDRDHIALPTLGERPPKVAAIPLWTNVLRIFWTNSMISNMPRLYR